MTGAVCIKMFCMALPPLAYRVAGESVLESSFAYHLRIRQLRGFQREYQFHPERKWRFDFADPNLMLAVECQGGIFSGGRHNRGAAMLKEFEKMNAAARAGWRVFFVGPGKGVSSASAVADILESIVKETV